jgi:GDP-L-fucose synthase
MDVIGYDGLIVQDMSKPDGMPRKPMNVARLAALGRGAMTWLRAGIKNSDPWVTSVPWPRHDMIVRFR